MKLNQSKLLTAFICIMLLLNSTYYICFASSSIITISGSVYLPSGTVAPVDGVDIQVFASQNGNVINYVDVLIPENSNSTSYSFTVPYAVSSAYIVGYWMNTTEGIYADGYYNKTATTDSISSATLISGLNGDNSNVNITLMRQDKIKGTISLPYGETAPAGGIKFELYGISNGVNVGDYPDVTIMEGANKVEYTLNITNTNDSADFKIGYWVLDYETGYLDGYYNNNGTVADAADAGLVTVSDGIADGINIYVLMPNAFCMQEPEICNQYNELIDTLIGQSSVKVLTRVTNTNSTDENIQFIVALFDPNSKLIRLAKDSTFLTSYDSSLLTGQLSLDGISSGYYIKVFLWDKNNITPLMKNIVFE